MTEQIGRLRRQDPRRERKSRGVATGVQAFRWSVVRAPHRWGKNSKAIKVVTANERLAYSQAIPCLADICCA